MKRPLLLAALLLTACAPAPAAAPAAVRAPLAGPVTAVGRVGLQAADRRLMADPDPDLQPWQASDVAAVVLTVTRDGQPALTPIRLEGAAIDAAVTLRPLDAGVAYAVVGRAYRSAGAGEVAIDAYDADPESCTTTFTTDGPGTTVIDRPFKIRFGARPYAGGGTTTLEIGDGAVDSPASAPVIDVNVRN